MAHRTPAGFASLVALSAALLAIGCSSRGPRELTVEFLQTPAPPSSIVPQATELDGGRTLLSWQTPLSSGGYSFEMAVRSGTQWSEIRRIAIGPGLSMFSADLPAVAPLPNGKLLAYWELKDQSGRDPYATKIQTAVSRDEGRTWSTPISPYGDAPAGQHSFLSWFRLEGGLGLVWLDAEEQAKVRLAAAGHHAHENATGSIGLRFSALDGEGKALRGGFVDPITCECCPTSAAATIHGPIVAYRGRLEEPGTKPSNVQSYRPTVRDIYVTRLDGDQWTKPLLVHADNWVINACPDNGPSIDARGDTVAVAWWTGSHERPKVKVAFSKDSGDTFGPSIPVDLGKPEGQVTVVLFPNGTSAVVGWLEQGKTWFRTVGITGSLGIPQPLGSSPGHSRLPKWISREDGVLAAWSSLDNGVRRVQLSQIQFKNSF